MKWLCPQCRHPLQMHGIRPGSVCGHARCKCKVVGITKAQEEAFERAGVK